MATLPNKPTRLALDPRSQRSGEDSYARVFAGLGFAWAAVMTFVILALITWLVVWPPSR